MSEWRETQKYEYRLQNRVSKQKQLLLEYQFLQSTFYIWVKPQYCYKVKFFDIFFLTDSHPNGHN